MEGLTLGSAAVPQRNDLIASRISRVDKGAGKNEPEMVAQEIESLFATLLVSEMRKGLGDGFFGSGAGSDTFNGWFDEEIGASLSSRGSLGLADAVHESLIREKAAADAEALRHKEEGKEEPEAGPAGALAS
jgi:Rod binding domain-containing protein